MEERCPELLERLYQPFVWNRAREHPPGDPLTSTLPVFNTAPDAPPARFNPFMIFDGYKVAGKPIDNIGDRRQGGKPLRARQAAHADRHHAVTHRSATDNYPGNPSQHRLDPGRCRRV